MEGGLEILKRSMIKNGQVNLLIYYTQIYSNATATELLLRATPHKNQTKSNFLGKA